MSNLTLDELLDSLGFKTWETIANSFILPIACIFGSVSCFISAFIFFMKPFADPVFFYYRLHSILNVLTLVFNMFFGVCFSPRLMPNQDTYACAIYNAASIWLNHFMYHYLDVIEICILIERMKIFSPFVKKHFKSRPVTISLILFIVCIIIDAPFLYACKPGPMGDYYYIDSSGARQQGRLYNIIPTEVAFTQIGSMVLAISNVISNVFTLIVCIAFNIVSLIQYKSYLRKRRRNTHESTSNSLIRAQPSSSEVVEILNRKLRRERKSEKNLFYMIITLGFVSIISRFAFMANFTLYLFDFTFSGGLVLNTLSKIFRKEIKRIFTFSSINGLTSLDGSSTSAKKDTKLNTTPSQTINKEELSEAINQKKVEIDVN